jgi:hypothetical protein
MTPLQQWKLLTLIFRGKKNDYSRHNKVHSYNLNDNPCARLKKRDGQSIEDFCDYNMGFHAS